MASKAALVVAIAGNIFVSSSALADWSQFEIPSEVRTKYRYLTQERLVEMPDGSMKFHKGRLWRRNGINVLYVHGDRYEMAYQHGRLLKQEISQGSLTQASKISENGLVNNLGAGLGSSIMNRYVTNNIVKKMLQHAIEQQGDGGVSLSEGWGLSEATGIPMSTLLMAALGPESAQVLLGKTSDKEPDVIFEPDMVNHCTAFAAWGEATADGGMIIGRNTDYPLNGYYDRFPTVIYYHPTDGAQKYMSVTTAGFHNAGVVGFNESGLYLSIHTVPTLHVSELGIPVFMIGQEVLRRATSFDQALEAIQKLRSAAGWNYTLVSTRENRAATIEIANDGIAVRMAIGNSHITTNHWLTPEMQAKYLHMNNSVDDDTRARFRRVRQLINEGYGSFTARHAMEILGDKFDVINGVTRPFPNTVAVMTTLSSSVWEPHKGIVYVANGEAPVSQNEYVGLPTVDRFDPETFVAESYAVMANRKFRDEHPEMYQAEKLLIEAKKKFEYLNDAAGARRSLETALSLSGDNPALHYVYAMTALRSGQTDTAIKSFTKVIEMGWDQQRVLVAHFYRARAYAHKRDRTSALRDLAAVKAHPLADEKIKKAATEFERDVRGILVPRVQDKDVPVMFQQSDSYRYGKVKLL